MTPVLPGGVVQLKSIPLVGKVVAVTGVCSDGDFIVNRIEIKIGRKLMRVNAEEFSLLYVVLDRGGL